MEAPAIAPSLKDTILMLERCIEAARSRGLRETTDLLRLAKADLQRREHGITEQELDVALALLRMGTEAKRRRKALRARRRK